MKKKNLSVDELLESTINKQLSILQDKLDKSNDLKTLGLLKQQILKFKAELEALNPEPKKKEKKSEQLDFTEEIMKPDFARLKIGDKK